MSELLPLTKYALLQSVNSSHFPPQLTTGHKRPDSELVSRVSRACASVQAELQTRSLIAMQQGARRM
jgi:hypothetical protein